MGFRVLGFGGLGPVATHFLMGKSFKGPRLVGEFRFYKDQEGNFRTPHKKQKTCGALDTTC